MFYEEEIVESRRARRLRESAKYLKKHPHKAKKRDALREPYEQQQMLKQIGLETRSFCEDSNSNMRDVKYYSELDNLDIGKVDVNNDTEYIFTTSDVVEHMRQSYKTCFLVFASPNKPGGGYLNGSSAQEEMIAYNTNLGYALECDECTPMYDKESNDYAYSSDMVYIRKLYVIRNKKNKIIPEKKWREQSAIVSAAVNYNHFIKKHTEEEYETIMKDRVNRILKIALIEGNDTIVLGPWGCGVFGGDVKRVTKMFLDNEYIKMFEIVVFLSNDKETVSQMESVYLGVE